MAREHGCANQDWPPLKHARTARVIGWPLLRELIHKNDHWISGYIALLVKDASFLILFWNGDRTNLRATWYYNCELDLKFCKKNAARKENIAQLLRSVVLLLAAFYQAKPRANRTISTVVTECAL